MERLGEVVEEFEKIDEGRRERVVWVEEVIKRGEEKSDEVIGDSKQR